MKWNCGLLLATAGSIIALSSAQDTCQNNVDCLNGGTCVVDTSSDVSHANSRIPNYCDCAQGYNGVTCENYCPVNCENGGVCEFQPDVHSQGVVESDYVCKCRPNFKGRHCNLSFVTCADGLECFNGARCVESQIGAGVYACECPYTHQGVNCEEGLEVEFCADGTQCINGGVCRISDATDLLEDVYECACPSTHRGQFCQDLVSVDGGGLSPGAIAGIVIGVLFGVFALSMLFVMKKTSKRTTRDASTAGDDLNMDGSAMKNASNGSAAVDPLPESATDKEGSGQREIV